MQYISITSNPDKGNAYFIKTNKCNLIIDAGFTKQAIHQFLHYAALSPSEIHGIVITHVHIAHTKGLKFLLDLNPDIPVYAPKNVFPNLKFAVKNKVVIQARNTFWIQDILVTPIWVKHGTETLNFTFSVSGEKLAYITNTGNIEKPLIDDIGVCQHFLIESHYHPGIARKYGPWEELKHIVVTDGHLSNEDASEIVARCSDESLQTVLLCNVSKYNDPNLPIVMMYSVIQDQKVRLEMAPNNHFGPWMGSANSPSVVSSKNAPSDGLLSLIESLSSEQQQEIFSKIMNL